MLEANKISGSIIEALSPARFAISKRILVLWLLILAYTLFFSVYTLQRHATFNTFAADLSYIDQPMWNTLHGRFLERTLGDRQVSRVAEHLEPIIIPIALIFYVWDDVRAILIVQTIALALGALPVYWIAREQMAKVRCQIANLECREIVPFVFVVVYLMFPALQAANVADFHADPFIVAPLLFAFWYASRERYLAMWGWAIVAMSVKENLPTLTFMLGLHLFFSSAPDSPASRPVLSRRRLHGLAMMAVSLVWFYVATFLIVAPLAREVYGTAGPVYLSSRYAGLGEGAGGPLVRLRSILSLPGEPDRLLYLAGLLASVGWLALLAPEYLLLGLPVLVANLFSNFPGQYSGEQHYSAPLAPVFVIAAIYGFRRLGIAASRRLQAGWLVRFVFPLLVFWLLAWSLGYHYLRGWTPLARDFNWPGRTSHHQRLEHLADQIPPEAPLSTTPPLHPHLAHREKIYVFPIVADARFVLLDISGRTDAHPNDIRKAFDALLESGEFEITDAVDGYVLLSKVAVARGEKQTLPETFYDFARAEDVKPQYPAQVEFDGRLRFVGYDVVDDPKWGQTHFRLYWQALVPLTDNPILWPVVFSEDGMLIEDTTQRPMVTPLWYPTSRWQPGETIITETLPWGLGERFNLGLAVLQGDSGLPGEGDPASAFNDPARRLRITGAEPGITLFHGDTWAQIGSFARDSRALVPAADDLALQRLDVTFAEGIRLNRYRIKRARFPVSHLTDLPAGARTDQISVLLEWQPSAPISRDYTVFVHLVAADGTIVGQADAQPAWVVPWPTSHWSAGQPVLDSHRLELPPGLSAGPYQIQVGLYYWETLERLPVLDQAMQPVSDHIVLGEIQVEP
ncbi:MAG: hypothetical protein Kow0063_26160 [Anaerolineae bacterium]